MQFDWTNIWYNNIKGETHLLIAPNSEHSCATALPEILNTAAAMVMSIAY
jgi:PhoPQ-activated pathogenicity-related protein